MTETTTQLQSARTEALGQEDDDRLVIHGAALGNDDVTVGWTGLKKLWPAEELAKAYETLEDCPLMKNHELGDVEAVIGSVTKTGFDTDVGVIYEAEINGDNDLERELYRKVQRGQLEVSVTVKHDPVEDAERDEETGAYIMTGLEFVELSLVPVGASPTADVAAGEHGSLAASLSAAGLSSRLGYDVDPLAISSPRDPQFSESETSPDWGEVDLSFDAFVANYANDDVDEWDDLSEADKRTISSKSLNGNPDADDWNHALVLPVVNPETDNLNQHGLEAALLRAPDTSDINGEETQNKIRSLLEDEFDTESESNSITVNVDADTSGFREKIEELRDQIQSLQNDTQSIENMTEEELQEQLEALREELGSNDDGAIVIEDTDEIQRLGELKKLDEEMAEMSDPVVRDRSELENLEQRAKQADEVAELFAEKLSESDDVPFSAEELQQKLSVEELRDKFDDVYGMEELTEPSNPNPKSQESAGGTEPEQEPNNIDELKAELDELKEKRKFYEKQGWSSHAEDVQDDIETIRAKISN